MRLVRISYRCFLSDRSCLEIVLFLMGIESYLLLGVFTNWTDYVGCDVCNNVTTEYRNRTCLLPVCVSDVDETTYIQNQ